MLADLNRRLSDKEFKVELTKAAKELVIERAYDPVYGARPLRRFVQHNIETILAKRIVAGDINPDSTLTVDVKNGELDVQ
jgi:ATP-dependent Clp protease ATP-binding subunit ClpB